MKMLAKERRKLFRRGLEEIYRIQARHYRRLTLDSAKVVTEKIIRRVGLRGDKRENYFRLLSICALINTEPLHRNWKERKKKCKAKRQLKLRKVLRKRH